MTKKQDKQLDFSDLIDRDHGSSAKEAKKANYGPDVVPGMPAPFARGSDTSRLAAMDIRKPGGRLRRRVLEFIGSCGDVGATCDEAVRELGMIHQTCSARINELVGLGLALDTGLRRTTSRGRSARVLAITALGREELLRKQELPQK